jgi:hypothetical protein
MLGAVVVTEMGILDGLEIPIEAVIFEPNVTTYARLLCPLKSLKGIPAGVLDDLFFKAVLN